MLFRSVVVGCVAPVAGAVFVVIGPAALVPLVHVVAGLLLGEAVALLETGDAGLRLAADEQGDHPLAVGQDAFRAPAYDNEGLTVVGLFPQPGGLNGENTGFHGVVQPLDAPAEEPASGGFLKLTEGFFVQFLFFCDFGQQVFVIYRQGKTGRQLFGDLMASAARLPAQGNNQLFHVGVLLLPYFYHYRKGRKKNQWKQG